MSFKHCQMPARKSYGNIHLDLTEKVEEFYNSIDHLDIEEHATEQWINNEETEIVYSYRLIGAVETDWMSAEEMIAYLEEDGEEEETDMEMIYVEMYKEDARWYDGMSDEILEVELASNYDNIVGIDIPREYVEAYYMKYENDFVEETMSELAIPKEECTFERWLNEVYICDDMSGLVDFVREEYNYDWGQTETCPDCEMENYYPYWNPAIHGFIARCKGCGRLIHLCDVCHWCDDKGNPSDDFNDYTCDWRECPNGDCKCSRGLIKKIDREAICGEVTV